MNDHVEIPDRPNLLPFPSVACRGCDGRKKVHADDVLELCDIIEDMDKRYDIGYGVHESLECVKEWVQSKDQTIDCPVCGGEGVE